MKLPEVAPYESCAVCIRGDTATGLVIEGSADFLIATYMKLGTDQRVAMKIVEMVGHDPSTPAFIRVCRSCAAKAGVPHKAIATFWDFTHEKPVHSYSEDTMFPHGVPGD